MMSKQVHFLSPLRENTCCDLTDWKTFQKRDVLRNPERTDNFKMYLTETSNFRGCFLTPLFSRIRPSESVFAVRAGTWFPRELGWKKAPKENTMLWFPLTYLGCS